MRRVSPALAVIAVVAAGLLLSACRQEEQGRVMRYEKGTYLGAPDTELSDTQTEELRARARNQGAL